MLNHFLKGCPRLIGILFCSVWVLSIAWSSQAFGQDKVGSKNAVPKSAAKLRLEPRELEKKVSQLSADLDATKQAVRDQAEAELLELGPSVVEYLPPIGTDASPEWRMRIERLRDSFSKLEMQQITLSSKVTLGGNMTAREALNRIADETGNKFQLGDAPNLDREVVTDFEATPFWEAFDEVVDQIEMTVAPGDGEAMQLVPRAPNAPLRISTAGYSGVFRIEPLTVQKTYQLQDPGRSTLQITVLLSWEPRLSPVFVKFPMESMKLICDDGQELQSKMTAEETEFTPTGGSQLQLSLDFVLPERPAKKIVKWQGNVFVSIPGKPATLEFVDLTKEGAKTATVGNLKVVLEKARKNRDIYEVLVGLSQSSPEQSGDAFRGWANTHEAFLMDKNNKRLEHVGWSTTRMSDKDVGLSYLFDVEKGLDGCKFMYRAPGSIVDQTIEFVLEDVPLP